MRIASVKIREGHYTLDNVLFISLGYQPQAFICFLNRANGHLVCIPSTSTSYLITFLVEPVFENLVQPEIGSRARFCSLNLIG